MADVFQKAFQYTAAKDAIASGYYPYFIALDGHEGAEAVYHGRRLLMFGSNNYLGLTTHPKVREAALRAIETYGTSCTGSRFLNGTLLMHEQLENELAEWTGKPAALVFSTGYQANLGAISALLARRDYAILDKDDHASIVDGVKLSFGEMKRFRHNDMQDLARALASLPEEAGKLVVVDGLFSMEGDIAPLPEMLPVIKQYGARLLVDDAHAMGVLGGGRGTAAHFGVTDEVDLIMSTFSKSFASLGGFIAGDPDVISFIKHTARSMIFSASIPPSNAAAALAALDIMRREPERVQQVNANAAYMRGELQRLGFDTGNSCTPVVPILMGEDQLCFAVWRELFDAGLFVNPVISPAVPQGRALLRTSYMATHTKEHMDRALTIYQQVGKAFGLIQ
ncbi:MAG: aminotransferase class I/II-fold pyridoxal phosphate-dependent enzyme [Caldilineales bacterium]